MSDIPERARVILDDWFGPLDDNGVVAEAKRHRWFTKDDAFDRYLRDTYEADVRLALAGEYDFWAEDVRGMLALILLLDQFTRNIYRNTPEMVCGDDKAAQLAERALEHEQDKNLSPPERHFLYMPLMHAENIARQNRCVELFEQLAKDTGTMVLDYAKRHRDIVARFGRFPHRNAILGRESTPEEVEFLKQPGSSF